MYKKKTMDTEGTRLSIPFLFFNVLPFKISPRDLSFRTRPFNKDVLDSAIANIKCS